MNRMDCREVTEQLSAFHDDELQEPGRRTIAAHLTGCASCRAQLAVLETLTTRLSAIGTHALPAGFEARMRDKLGLVDAATGQTRRWFALAASHLAAACLGALILYSAFSRTDNLNATARDAMTAYARAMMAEQSVQIASSDQHTVRPIAS